MLFKFAIVAIALFLLFKMFSNDKKEKGKSAKDESEKVVATGEMVKDPICGAYVEKDSDIRVRQGETVHCFCSFDCRDRFLKQLEAGTSTGGE